MKKSVLLPVALFALLLSPLTVSAQDFPPDDQISFNLKTEGWVTTQTARVMMHIESAVSEGAEGKMQDAMKTALNTTVKADWRLTGFNRSLDQTGLERWSATYEARLPENELNNLDTRAKKNSKAGMQISVLQIDFTPTLEETQTKESELRTAIYQMAQKQLALANQSLSDRKFRIATIDFTGEAVQPLFRGAPMAMMKTMEAQADSAEMAGGAPMSSQERSQKMALSARVILASSPKDSPQK